MVEAVVVVAVGAVAVVAVGAVAVVAVGAVVVGAAGACHPERSEGSTVRTTGPAVAGWAVPPRHLLRTHGRSLAALGMTTGPGLGPAGT